MFDYLTKPLPPIFPHISMLLESNAIRPSRHLIRSKKGSEGSEPVFSPRYFSVRIVVSVINLQSMFLFKTDIYFRSRIQMNL